MSNSNENKLVPKLRFSEFKNADEWELRKLGELGDVVASGDLDSKLFSLVKSDIFKYPVYSNAVEKDGLYGYYSSFKYLEDSITITARGNLGIAFLRTEKFMGIGRLVVVSNLRNALPKFLAECWNYLAKIPQEVTSIPQLTAVAVKAIELPVPKDKSEQQKIADCLSSLDELIDAERQKLDALKEHKKGLMRQLFPAEGETVPKLRFKGFSGEWKEKSIQELIDDRVIVSHLDGNHGELYPRAEEFSKNGIPYISANDFITGAIDFTKCKYLPEQRASQFRKGVANSGDILFAHNATVGPVAKLVTTFPYVILSTTATYFRCDSSQLLNDFLKFALESPRFVKQYTRVMSQSTRNQVPITTQRRFDLQIPHPDEQHKIAYCLSAVDELIAAQTEKTEQLQEHKKGLMQGLFPEI